MPRKEPAPLKFPPEPEIAALFQRVLDEAVRFPGIEESRSYGTPAIKVKGKFMARLRSEAEGSLAILSDIIDRQMLMQAAPETFFITDHYADSAMVLINLKTVRWEAMPGILEAAWRMAASPKAIAAFEQARSEG